MCVWEKRRGGLSGFIYPFIYMYSYVNPRIPTHTQGLNSFDYIYLVIVYMVVVNPA